MPATIGWPCSTSRRAASRRSRRSRQGKNINPQWNPDSRSLFFVSDQSGISNVYRVDVQSGALAQITNIDSGISGITALSPAISSAIDARTLAISAYEDGSHHIYIIDRRSSSPARRSSSTVARLQAASLPPVAARIARSRAS